MAQEDQATHFFVEVLDPVSEEFFSHDPTLLKARLAAICALHMADHFFYARLATGEAKKDDAFCKDFIGDLSKSNEYFAIIRDVANASKHAKLIRKGRLLTDASQVQNRPTVWGELRWGEFKWGGSEQIVVELDNGAVRGFEVALHKTIQMWRNMLGLPPKSRSGFPD